MLKRNIHLRFIAGTLFIFAMVAILDFAIGGLLKKYYFRQASGLDYRTTYSIEQTRADLLIFGSSTAIHDFSPMAFERRLNLSAYNVGRDGMSIFYDYAILNAVLKRYTPKIIILAFDKDEFWQDEGSYDRLSSLLPFYKSHPEVDSIVNLRGPYEKYKMMSSIYPYNSLVFTIFAGNSEFNKKKRADVQGFVPLDKTWNDPMKLDSSSLNEVIDSNKVRVYESFVRSCSHAKIELYVICSPRFAKATHPGSSIILGRAIAERYGASFLDYSDDADLIHDRTLFADVPHLNLTGATIYSNKVADRILDEKKSNSWDKVVYRP